MLWWLGKDDDEIQSLPEWRKSLFWNLNLRPLLEPLDIEPTPFGDYMFSFPKPFLLGHLYGTLPEKALDQVYEKDQNAITKWFARLFESAPLPINPMGLVPKSAQKKLGVSTGEEWPGIMNWQMFPTALKPALEANVNRDTFRRQPIENLSQQKLPPEMRMNPNTSLVARKAGEYLGASPLKIDHLIRGYTAGLGKYGTDSADWLLVQNRLIDIPTPPKKLPHEYPVVRAFVKSPYAAPRQVGQFYRAQKIVTQRIEAFRALGAHSGTKAQKSLWKADKELVMFYAAEVPRTGKSRADMLQDVRRRMSEVNKAMLNVQMSRTISAGDKRDRLLWLSHVRNTLAEVGVEILHPKDFKQTR
jgi:hypothetical protein